MTTEQQRRRHPVIAALVPTSVVFALLTTSAPASSPIKPPAARSAAALSNKQIVSRAVEALVSIEAQSADGIPLAQGSGFFFGKENRVLTNLHVIKWAHRLVIKRLADHVRYQAVEVAALDTARDICLLVVDAPRVNGLSPARPGATAVGDAIIVAGTPQGLEGTFTQGMVSALRSDLDRIQIDAPISPGSSGGPVLNKHGDVIGIATSSLQSGQLLNFAVPIEAATTMKALGWTIHGGASLAVRDVELHSLKGRPKQVDEREATVTAFYPATGQLVEGTRDLKETTVYDEAGMVARYTYFGGGVRVHEERYEYFEAPIPKRMTQFINYGSEDGGPKESETDYSWLNGAKMRYGRIRYGETIISGDQDGPAKRSRGEGVLLGKAAFGYDSTTYDGYGRIVATEQYGLSAGGRRMDDFKSTTRYDEHGWKHEYRDFSIDGKARDAYTYTYEIDKQGNWITQVTWIADEKAPTGRAPIAARYRTISYY